MRPTALERSSTTSQTLINPAYNKLFRNNQISHPEANKDGRNLSKIARDNGIQLGKAPHPTFGTVHTYPKAMMDSFYRGEYH